MTKKDRSTCQIHHLSFYSIK